MNSYTGLGLITAVTCVLQAVKNKWCREGGGSTYTMPGAVCVCVCVCNRVSESKVVAA